MHNLADIIMLPLVCFGMQQMLDFLETKCVILCNWLDVHDISKLFWVRFCGHIVSSTSRYRPVVMCAIFFGAIGDVLTVFQTYCDVRYVI